MKNKDTSSTIITKIVLESLASESRQVKEIQNIKIWNNKLELISGDGLIYIQRKPKGSD